MDRDELAEYLKNPYVRVIGGATRGPDPGLSANTTVYGHETDQTHYLPANTARPGGTPGTGVARPPGPEIDPSEDDRSVLGIGSKYRNRKTEYNGRLYDSKKEAEFAEGLDLRVKAGEILSWIPQVSIPLPGGVRHMIDFMVIKSDLSDWKYRGANPTAERVFSFVEIKGRDLPMGKLKRKQVEEIYKVEVVLI